jgi:hypothetical protein
MTYLGAAVNGGPAVPNDMSSRDPHDDRVEEAAATVA